MVRSAATGTRDHPDFAGFYAACAHHDLVVGLHPFPFADVEWSQAILPDLGGVPSSQIQMRTWSRSRSTTC
jgi:hypothetical protein